MAQVANATRAAENHPATGRVVIEHSLAASVTQQSGAGQFISSRDALIFVPSGLVPGHTYPLVVAFAYNGDPSVPMSAWRQQAEQNQWIVYASRQYTNSTLHGGLASSDAVASQVKTHVDALSATLPIDPSRIIFTGMSGGANYAEFMNLRYPGYAAGIIINSGRIPNQLFSRKPTPGFLTMPTSSAFGDSRRIAVFLCSPTDGQFYGISHANDRTMQQLGWDTLFLNFVGGHKNAPPATYHQAIDWILAQPSWTATA